jgi:hypothetical protein
MPGYSNGKIYRLSSPETNAVYIGSTTRPLYTRMAEHRRDWKLLSTGVANKGYKKTSATEVTQFPSVQITLLEEYPCESREELHARERHHVLQCPFAVNRADPINGKRLAEPGPFKTDEE